MAQRGRGASTLAHDGIDRDGKADGPALLRAQAAQPRRSWFPMTAFTPVGTLADARIFEFAVVGTARIPPARHRRRSAHRTPIPRVPFLLSGAPQCGRQVRVSRFQKQPCL